ncbi:hypothetical protein [Janthinobacterium violaceinigrum]|uniref:Uncharacterized protein n=1 Tax=Janthinobacterium violaceinigrum TaxID=2654252 RepID=A0A6I1I5S0_9BURK|nr:hypothetical protein [Janthinobacterium violaceinigrum]KAB8066245.1 hypothetical protein GCN75_03350 [Janthinobacterium violaceinigrum]
MLNWLTWFRWATLMIALGAMSYYGYRAVPWSYMDATLSAYWVAAIGTTGTLIGTIALASSEARTRQRERMTLAVIQAAHCQHKMQAMLLGLERIAELLGPSTKKKIPIDNVLNSINEIDSIVFIDNQELATLVPLKGHCAMKIAGVQNALSNLRKHILDIDTVRPASDDEDQSIGLDIDATYFAAAIAKKQVERLWEVMHTFKESIYT